MLAERLAEGMETATSAEHRVESRNNIFVMAALYAGSKVTPVRIRNMSTSGALIEAAALPPKGTTVRLSRGSISVAGDVMWSDERRAGLRFTNATVVADWLPQGKRGSGQQLIDEIVHQARIGGAPKAAANPPSPRKNSELADELLQLRNQLERAAEQLASDIAVAAQHVSALQTIDGATQVLARLALEAVAAQRPAMASSGT